jgi:xylose isomerase
MNFTPRREDKFIFGLCTVGNIERDPFGERVRQPFFPVEIVHLLAEMGAYEEKLYKGGFYAL